MNKIHQTHIALMKKLLLEVEAAQATYEDHKRATELLQQKLDGRLAELKILKGQLDKKMTELDSAKDSFFTDLINGTLDDPDDHKSFESMSEIISEYARSFKEAKVYTLNGDHITDENSFYTEIAKVCGFPDYFGRNLDALNDCLYDLRQQHPEGVEIHWLNVHPYLRDYAEVTQGNPLVRKNLLDHMEEVCRSQDIKFQA